MRRQADRTIVPMFAIYAYSQGASKAQMDAAWRILAATAIPGVPSQCLRQFNDALAKVGVEVLEP